MYSADVKRKINDYADMINEKLVDYLPEANDGQRDVVRAMKYSLTNGGKRLRPILVLEFCKACGGDSVNAVAFACAIEYIHTYSLIHDDLPCMDDDDMRRGNPSCHKMFGEATALLAGDALLTHAFDVACDANLAPEQINSALSLLSQNAGVGGMIGGQVVDVEMTGKELSKEQLEYVYENKTGALVEASMMIGAILAGADEAKVAAVHKIASDVGMAFQIQDDILDVCGDSALLGKPTLSDEENGKVTYVTIHGIDESRRYVTELSERAVRELEEIGGDNEFLKELVIWLINRDK